MHLPRPTRKTVRLAAVSLTCWLALSGAARPEEPADEKARAEEFRAFAVREAGRYSFRPADPQGLPFTLRPEPILQWSNPVVGSIYGDVFVWTAKGRPEVVASLYKWFSPFSHRTNEFLSLSTRPVVGEREGRPVWSPARPGVEFKPVSDAPAPAATAPQRLRQMRELAKDFTARQTDRAGVDRDMRLLNQPLYRYETTEGALIDGALFVFVLGTDPEAFLLLEDREVDGKPRWEYALARMNSIEIRVSHRGRALWTAEMMPYAVAAGHSAPYTTFRFDPGNDPSTR
jgi:hypothetical protein